MLATIAWWFCYWTPIPHPMPRKISTFDPACTIVSLDIRKASGIKFDSQIEFCSSKAWIESKATFFLWPQPYQAFTLHFKIDGWFPTLCRYNSRNYRWVASETWSISAEFDLEASNLQESKLDLVLEGVDTVADVYINNELAGKCRNAHRYIQLSKHLIFLKQDKLCLLIFRKLLRPPQRKQRIRILSFLSNAFEASAHPLGNSRPENLSPYDLKTCRENKIFKSNPIKWCKCTWHLQLSHRFNDLTQSWFNRLSWYLLQATWELWQAVHQLCRYPQKSILQSFKGKYITR